MTERIAENLTPYLAGFINNRPDNLNLLLQYPDWQRMAQLQVDRRATRFLEALPDAELQAIAQGQVNLADLVTKLTSA